MSTALAFASSLFLVVQFSMGHPASVQDLENAYRCESTVDVEEGTHPSVLADGLLSPSHQLPNTKCPSYVPVADDCFACFSMDTEVKLRCRMKVDETCPKLFLENGSGKNGPKAIKFAIADVVRSGAEEDAKFTYSLVLALLALVFHWF